MNKFESHSLTKFNKQYGVDISINVDDKIHVLKVFSCSIDGYKIRTELNDSNLLSLTIDVEDRHFIQPEVSQSDCGQYFYVKFDDIRLDIKLDDEAIFIDTFEINNDEFNDIDYRYCGYDEL